jgi:hypothetical protein
MKYFQVETIQAKSLLFCASNEEEAIGLYVQSLKGSSPAYITDVCDVTERELKWRRLNKIAQDKHREILENAN